MYDYLERDLLESESELQNFVSAVCVCLILFTCSNSCRPGGGGGSSYWSQRVSYKTL